MTYSQNLLFLWSMKVFIY